MATRRKRAASTAEADPSAKNLRLIADLERQALAKRTFGQRMGDRVASIAGKLWFSIAHAVFFTVWIVAGIDPFPYPFLTLVVSLEAIFLSLFILMSQNRANHQADQRAHLDLQVNLLAEAEMTKVLRMLKALCAAMNLSEADDPEVVAMSRNIQTKKLVDEIERNLPESD